MRFDRSPFSQAQALTSHTANEPTQISTQPASLLQPVEFAPHTPNHPNTNQPTHVQHPDAAFRQHTPQTGTANPLRLRPSPTRDLASANGGGPRASGARRRVLLRLDTSDRAPVLDRNRSTGPRASAAPPRQVKDLPLRHHRHHQYIDDCHSPPRLPFGSRPPQSRRETDAAKRGTYVVKRCGFAARPVALLGARRGGGFRASSVRFRRPEIPRASSPGSTPGASRPSSVLLLLWRTVRSFYLRSIQIK